MNAQPVAIESSRTVVLIAYGLHLFGAIIGLPSIIGLIVNYVERTRYGGLTDSHHRWMIRSFWWALLWIIVGGITTFILIGWLILGLAWLWYVYRHVRGLIVLLDGRSMPY
jgi:uncharacterized membrane protein